MLGDLGEAWVITRANNRPAIERSLVTDPLPNVNFIYVDLPPWARRWKRGQRGVRLYYVLWQGAALREARRLSKEKVFDLAWHLTLANAWIGSVAGIIGVPFIYGPVGAGVGTPWRLAAGLGGRGILYEATRAAARVAGRYLNPLARLSWRRAELILAQNEETKHWFPRRHRAKCQVFPHIVLSDLPEPPRERAQHVMLFVGRLLPWKGAFLAIRALEALPEWRLIVCGDGPDAMRLLRLATRLGLMDRVEFRGWVEHGEVLRTMREDASVFVFPSLHDEAGWVVVEAMAAGLPVVCLDAGGPPSLAGDGLAVTPSGTSKTVEHIAERVLQAAQQDPELPRIRVHEFQYDARLERLHSLLTRALNPRQS